MKTMRRHKTDDVIFVSFFFTLASASGKRVLTYETKERLYKQNQCSGETVKPERQEVRS